MNIEKRKATPSDFELTFRLKKSAGGEYIRKVFGWDEDLQIKLHREQYTPSNTELIVKDSKEIGWISVFLRNDHIKIDEMYIIPQHQNKGIGSILVRKVISDAESKNLTAQLRVFKINPAVKLYERLGFQIYDEDGPFYIMKYEKS